MPDKFAEIVTHWGVIFGAVGAALASFLAVVHRLFISDPVFRKIVNETVDKQDKSIEKFTKDAKEKIEKGFKEHSEALEEYKKRKKQELIDHKEQITKMVNMQNKQIESNETQIKVLSQSLIKIEQTIREGFETHDDKNDEKFMNRKEVIASFTEVKLNLNSINETLKDRDKAAREQMLDELRELKRENEQLKRTERG